MMASLKSTMHLSGVAPPAGGLYIQDSDREIALWANCQSQ